VRLRGVVLGVVCLAAACWLTSCSAIVRVRSRAISNNEPKLYAKLSKALGDSADFKPSQTLRIYSSDGVEIGRAFGENRTYVALGDIPKPLRQATVAIEDSRFYSHSGIGATNPPSSGFVCVTGVIDTETDGARVVPVLIVRDPAEINPL